jgi:ubiquitin-conjugating enzyme E2 Z
MSSQSHKRIMRVDMKTIEKLELSKLGIFVDFEESDISNARAMIIGPEGTPYEDGVLYFSIKFPRDYPFSPPLVQYYSFSRIRVHPNLYVGKSHQGFLGKVCLSILNTWSGPKWSPIQTISSVLLTIQSLLCPQPITNEPGYQGAKKDIRELFNRIVYHDTLETLVLLNHRPPLGYEAFKDPVYEHFKRSRGRILSKAQSYAKQFTETQQPYFKVYNAHPLIDFPKIYKRIQEWSESF